jgi:hypothetical protein
MSEVMRGSEGPPGAVSIWSWSPGCGTLKFYYESIKRELKKRPINECRCDERLKTKDEESTRLRYTGFLRELEHLKIKARLIDEKYASVMGEYVFLN